MDKKENVMAPQIAIVHRSDKQGSFVLSPLSPGFGVTLGNSLRRVLYSYIEGYAISNIFMYTPVKHEFDTIKGVRESLQEIILNLKAIRFKKVKENKETNVVISLQGKKAFKGSDITKASSSFKVLNPDAVICNMEKDVHLHMELTITQGRGYVTAEEIEQDEKIDHSFPIDAIYQPVINVVFRVENILFKKKTDYEKLILDITTDGSISPEKALRNASSILSGLFTTITTVKIDATKVLHKDSVETQEAKKDKDRIKKILEAPLSSLDVSARIVNSLTANGFTCLKDIMGKSVPDLLSLSNFGRKSLEDLEAFLEKQNLGWQLKKDKA